MTESLEPIHCPAPAAKAPRADEYKPHTLSNIFPPLEGEQFGELVEDIRANGLREPIVLYEGKILDGCNRYRACLEAGVEPISRDYDGTDPLAYVVSRNLRRRHLSQSQRAMIASKIATLRDGQRQVGKFAEVPTQAQAAQDVERLRARRKAGSRSPQQRQSVSMAANVAQMPKDAQIRLVALSKEESLAWQRKTRAANPISITAPPRGNSHHENAVIDNTAIIAAGKETRQQLREDLDKRAESLVDHVNIFVPQLPAILKYSPQDDDGKELLGAAASIKAIKQRISNLVVPNAKIALDAAIATIMAYVG